MRRQYRGRSDAMVKNSEGEQGFWPSYADMMSAVALILFFLMLLSYIQNLITGNDLRNTQEVLEETRGVLSMTLKQVDDARTDLEKVTVDLDEARLTLARQQEDMNAMDRLLADQEAMLGQQEALIGEQEAYISAANDELVAMRVQMQTIAVLRLSILEQIRDSMAQVMGDSTKVRIGSNGNIILNEGILFDLNSSEIKEEAAPALNELTDVFRRFLQDGGNAEYVDSIVISGHTDSSGSAEHNRELSTARANAVLNYLMENDRGKLDGYEQYFCAAGYGMTRPVASNDTAAGRAANRRIEISIILRDDTVMDIVESYLEMELPGRTGEAALSGGD